MIHSRIKNSDELCRHYTGFPDYERLNSCLSNLSVGVNSQHVGHLLQNQLLCPNPLGIYSCQIGKGNPLIIYL